VTVQDVRHWQCERKCAPVYAELTAQLIDSRKRISDIEHLKTWNADLRHRVWRGHVKAEIVGLDAEEQVDLEREVDLYLTAVLLIDQEVAA